MTTSMQSQFGAKIESNYGTVVAPDRFWQFLKAELDPKQVRLDGNGMRATRYMELSSQSRVAAQGGTLKTDLEWMTKGMGWFGTYLLGTVTTTGPTDSAYTHTMAFGALSTSFTSQLNIPLHPSTTDAPFTLGGCVVDSWELGCDVDGVVTLSLTIDAQNIGTATALASASYASGSAPYAWIDAGLTIGGTSTPIHSWKIKVDNGLKTDRYKQQTSALKQQPTQDKRPKVSVEIDPDFTDRASGWDRVRATLAANAFATAILTMTPADTGLIIGTATQPSTTITIPKLRFDDVKGLMKEYSKGEVVQKISAVARDDGSNSPLSIVYVSADATA